jgi:exopolyphosphatase/guanosine-5'-triphosphate,3'-diphosphate pyrophosphatase
VVSLQRGRGKIKLALNKRWASQHPRTLHLLEEEVRRWGAQERRPLEVSLVA